MTIELQNVQLQPSDGKSPPLLDDVSVTFQPGQITLVVGKTGAGKSTLLRAAAGLELPSGGTVLCDGEPVWRKRKVSSDVLKKIGFVFQYPEQQLFASTVRGEFTFSLKPYNFPPAEANERTHRSMEQMGLESHLLDRSPLTLSGGQKRRIALATTFATDAKWLFLDEPTAGLDPLATQLLLQVLMEWRTKPNRGVIVATHDLDAFFPIADRVIVLCEGQIVRVSTPSWLCQHPEVLEDACVGSPSCVQAASAISMRGVPVASNLYTPDSLAAHIAQAMAAEPNLLESRASCVEAEPMDPERVEPGRSEASPGLAPDWMDEAKSFSDGPAAGFLHSLDPRAKWVCYVLVSAAVLMQHRVVGVLCATVGVLGLVLLARMSPREVFRYTRPFLLLILLSVALSGIRISMQNGMPLWHWFGFSPGVAAVTFRSLYNLLLVMVLGGILAFTTTQLAMKRGLEQGLSALNRVKFPVAAFSLGTSLVLRFVPVILGEVRRFMVIVRARGKSSVRMGQVRFRDLPALVIPLLLSVFQFGEDISLAMEARGYVNVRQSGTGTDRRRMNRKDGAAIAASGLFLILLFAVSLL